MKRRITNMSDRPEIELLPMRAIASVTVAKSEYMNREHGFASPVDGDDRIRHEYRHFVRAGRMPGVDDYEPMEPPC